MNNAILNQVRQYAMASMNDPRLMQNTNFQNAVGMFKNHQSSNLLQYANNLCKEYGMTYEDAKKKLGL